MKRVLLSALVISVVTLGAGAQVINFGKTQPVRSFSMTFAPVLNMSSIFHPDLMGMSFIAMAGYGLNYSMDLGVKYGYYNGSDYFGAELQYLVRENRKSYYCFYGGLHKWEEYGIDLLGSVTYTPQYWANLSTGLDLDIDISELQLRAWIPLNFGINFDDRFFLFVEYDLPATEFAWDIFGGGLTYIIR